jgi:hypothetical protein
VALHLTGPVTDDEGMTSVSQSLRLVLLATLLAITAGLLSGSPARAGADDPYIADEVPVARGCIVLGRAWAGVKVALVQRRLGTTHELDRYGSDTYRAVQQFQERRGLKVTGKVNEPTWTKLGMTRDFCMDRFTVQPRVGANATADRRVNAMIRWARAQVGRTYIWGGAGPIGYDCSGLALQAMYAGGRVLPTVTTYQHQRRDFGTASAIFDSGLPRVALADRQRGDLIFYGPSGSISHMAIYLGNDRVIEAVRPQVRASSMWGHSVPAKPRVVRPFGRR